jgi:hypothetical protein
MSFLVGYYGFSWTGPTGTAPSNNAPAPINVSATGQTKEGNLSAAMFYDTNDPSYYINPSGATSAILAGNVGIGTTNPGTNNLKVAGKTETLYMVYTPTSVPSSPTEGQMYWNNVTHAFYFYNGTSWQKVSGTAQAYCQSYPTQTDDANCGIIDCSGWYVKTGTEGVNDTQYCYNKTNITTNRCEGVDDCKDPNTADCDSQSNNALQYSCGSCKYISSSACTGTTLGSCTNYPRGTACTEVAGGHCRSDGTCGATVVTYKSDGSTSCSSYCASLGLSCIGVSTSNTAIDNQANEMNCNVACTCNFLMKADWTCSSNFSYCGGGTTGPYQYYEAYCWCD